MPLLLRDKSLWLWLRVLLGLFELLIHISHVCAQDDLVNRIILLFCFPLSYIIWILRDSFIKARVGALKAGCCLRCHYWVGPSTPIIVILKLYSMEFISCDCSRYIRCFPNWLGVWRCWNDQCISRHSILVKVSQIRRLNCWNIFLMISCPWTLGRLFLKTLISSKASFRIQSWWMVHCFRGRFRSQHVRLVMRRWILWSYSTYLSI